MGGLEFGGKRVSAMSRNVSSMVVDPSWYGHASHQTKCWQLFNAISVPLMQNNSALQYFHHDNARPYAAIPPQLYLDHAQVIESFEMASKVTWYVPYWTWLGWARATCMWAQRYKQGLVWGCFNRVIQRRTLMVCSTHSPSSCRNTPMIWLICQIRDYTSRTRTPRYLAFLLYGFVGHGDIILAQL